MRKSISPPHQKSGITQDEPIRVHPDYEIVSQISADTTGVLYRAKSIQDNTPVAIRLFSAEVRPRRIPEEDTAPSLTHIAGVRQILRTEKGIPFAVLDMPEGSCLAHVLSREPSLPAELATRIALKVALIIRALHVHGICHGHVNPGSVFFKPQADGRIEVQLVYHPLNGNPVDFNLPEFLSPELCARTGTLSQSDDLWAVSILMYRMLTGQAPFAGTSPWEVLKTMRKGQFSLSGSVKSQFPLFSIFFQKTLAARASDRPDGQQMNLSLKSMLTTFRPLSKPLDSSIPASVQKNVPESVPESTDSVMTLSDINDLFEPVVEEDNEVSPFFETEEQDVDPVEMLEDLEDWELEEAWDFLDDSGLDDEQQTILLLGYYGPHNLDIDEGAHGQGRHSRSDTTRPLVLTSVLKDAEMEAATQPTPDNFAVDPVLYSIDDRGNQPNDSQGKAGNPNLSHPYKSSTLRSIDTTLLANKEHRKMKAARFARKIALNGGLAVVTFVSVLFLFREMKSDEKEPIRKTAAIQVVPSESGTPKTPGTLAGTQSDSTRLRNTASPDAPTTVENVTIRLNEVPPDAYILLNGIRTSLPIVVPKSQKPVAIGVIVGDRIVFSTTVSPLADQVITVAMADGR